MCYYGIMNTTEYSRKRLRKQYLRLMKTGFLLLRDISVILEPDFPYRRIPGPLFIRDYQQWYAGALACLEQVSPERATEFRFLYQGNATRKYAHDKTFTFREWLLEKRDYTNFFNNTNRLDRAEAALNLLRLQCEIFNTSSNTLKTFSVTGADKQENSSRLL